MLRGIENGAERGIQNFVRTGAGTGVGGEEFGALRKNVARGNGNGAVAVLAVILEKKNSAGLRGLLVDKSETVIAVAGEEFESDKRVAGENSWRDLKTVKQGNNIRTYSFETFN